MSIDWCCSTIRCDLLVTGPGMKCSGPWVVMPSVVYFPSASLHYVSRENFIFCGSTKGKLEFGFDFWYCQAQGLSPKSKSKVQRAEADTIIHHHTPPIAFLIWIANLVMGKDHPWPSWPSMIFYDFTWPSMIKFLHARSLKLAACIKCLINHNS